MMSAAWYLLHGLIIAEGVAQSTIDPISGSAGWIGSGILGGVLGWLLFVHLPAKDKQLVSLIDSRDSAIRDLTERHIVTLRELVERHDADSKAQTDRFTVVVTEITLKHAEVERDQRHDYRDSLNAITLRYEAEREFNSNAIRSNLDEQRSFLADAHRILDELRRVLGQPGAPIPLPGRAGRGVGGPEAKKG